MICERAISTTPRDLWALRKVPALHSCQTKIGVATLLPLLSIQGALVKEPIKLISAISIEDFVHHSELFRCVKKSKEAIQRLTNAKQRSDAKNIMGEVVERFITTGDLLESDLIRDSDIEDCFVLAFQEGKISQLQLGTFFFWKSFLDKNPDPSTHQKVGIENKEERDYLKGQFITAALSKYCQVSGSNEEEKNSAAEKLFEEWYEQACKLPPSERYFLKIRRKRPLFPAMPGGYLTDSSIVDRFIQMDKDRSWKEKRTSTVFMGNSENFIIMCPSMGMMNVFLGISKKQCAEIVVRFAARKNTIGPGRRDVTVRNSYQLTPTKADDYLAPGYEYTIHDLCFHTPIVNCIPIEEQTFLTDIAKIIKETLLPENSNGAHFSEKTIDSLIFKLTDMELKSDSKRPHENCISHLSNIFNIYSRYLTRNLFEKLHQTPLVEDVMREIFPPKEEELLLQEIVSFLKLDEKSARQFLDKVGGCNLLRQSSSSSAIWFDWIKGNTICIEEALRFTEFLESQPVTQLQMELLGYVQKALAGRKN